MLFKINRTGVMGGVALLLTALTLYDYLAGPVPPGSPSGRAQRAGAPAAISESMQTSAALRSNASSTSQMWQEIRTFTQLQDNAPAVALRYQSLAVPYAEIMAEVAVVHGADEKPEEVTKQALGALLPADVQIKVLLVAEGAVAQRGNTLLTVNISLESTDSRAMQQAVMALGNPAAGLVWRELSVNADSEKRLIQANGVLSVLAIRMAE